MDKDKLHKKNIRWAFVNHNNPRHLIKRTAPFGNFSEVEDAANAYKAINEITSLAGKKAAAKRKRTGLPGIFVRDNQLVTVTKNGAEKTVSTRPAQAAAFYIKYKPATILHAVKK